MINIDANDATVRPGIVNVTIADNSGAATAITFQVGSNAPVTQKFGQYAGTISFPVPMTPGVYPCSVMIQAFYFDASNASLNRTYSCDMLVDGNNVASAAGAIAPSATSDFGGTSLRITVQ